MNLGHGGNIGLLAQRAGLEAAELLDFSANINPLGPPDQLRGIINRSLAQVVHYPDPSCSALVAALATHHGIGAAQVVVGNGSTEIFYALPRLLRVRRAVIAVPSYADYQTCAHLAGLPVEVIGLAATEGFTMPWSRIEESLCEDDLVMLGQPNNPTGVLFDAHHLLRIADHHPATWFIVDEAFADFIPDYRSLIHAHRPNIVVVRSMTKFYAIPGLRLGYAMADTAVIDLLRNVLPPWSVGSLSQSVGIGVVADADYAQTTQRAVMRLREQLHADLSRIAAVTVFPGAANFLLLRLCDDQRLDAVALEDKLLEKGIAIRVCANFAGLDHRYFRVAVRTSSENQRLVQALENVLTPSHVSRTLTRHPKPAIMMLGTCSNAGKSLMTAAMGRILLQDGYRVAPFKAQNMSLNSFVTDAGGEMGRAQVVQAQACRLAPDLRMNPVLLKPTSDVGSQVIVLGQPVGNMTVEAYIAYKSELFDVVRKAYDDMAAEVDVMVLEGAGSPAEVNLKAHDIVNLAMADHSGAAALLVGDIDRGGVFAAFAGTVDLLSERERRLIAGFLINRFRGRAELLNSAIDILQRHTGLPTFGVVPYLMDVGLPEEDSVSFKSSQNIAQIDADTPSIEIAVLDLPYISNFTDLDALKQEPDVRLRVVRRVAELGTPDVLILPGSKNVIQDLRHLQRNGLVGALADLARTSATQVVGICGGFQLLGERIDDPHGIESDARAIEGLGLIRAVTTLSPVKSLKQVTARHLASGLMIKGYEIHHGQTHGRGARAAMVGETGEPIGLMADGSRIWGTYLHGLFDDDLFRRWFLDQVRITKGWAKLGRIVAPYDLEPALDRLAASVRAHIDVDAIYRKAGLR